MDYSKIKIEREVKIVFMGTPQFSVPILEGLIENYNVRAIVSQPDRNRKNGEIIFNPIKQIGVDNTILVIQPENINDAIDEVLALEPDLIVTCAYGQILPKEILDYPRLGCINVHASLLPKLRGGAPIHRSIINGHSETGITIMHMDEGMDTGDMISQSSITIANEETASGLHDKLCILGRDLLLETLPSIIDGTSVRTPQNENEASYGFVITRKDEKIIFSRTKKQIYNQIRGLNSWPGAYCKLEGKIFKVWESYQTDRMFSLLLDGEITDIYTDGIGVKVSNGEIVLTTIQPEGKRRMKAIDYLNGLEDKKSLIGKVLS